MFEPPSNYKQPVVNGRRNILPGVAYTWRSQKNDTENSSAFGAAVSACLEAKGGCSEVENPHRVKVGYKLMVGGHTFRAPLPNERINCFNGILNASVDSGPPSLLCKSKYTDYWRQRISSG